MTPGNSGASTPEDDDPFGYLYEDGRANGAQPPSSGYGYPNSVGRVRPVGERQYSAPAAPGQAPVQGQQPAYGQTAPTAPTAQYGQTIPQQQGAYGSTPNTQYQGPEAFGAGPATPRQPTHGGGGGRGGRASGPNTKGLLIGAIAVVAAVVIGIGVAMMGGDDEKDKGNEAGASPTTGQSAEKSPSPTTSAASEDELPTIDAKALLLGGGAVTTSDVKGAKSADGVYVGNFNNVGASVTWNVSGIAKKGEYRLYVNYGVPGKAATATLSVNGTAQSRPVNLDNFAKAAEGDYAKGWTSTWASVQLNKGTNTLKISCEQGNQCDVNIDQLYLTAANG
ncbi:CBM35 domain-containing protein [Streptomyces sp. SID12488]|uniref:CBM35 domain-containing protein n=1 Tax=Streptomyces sp. SID12488 TaxID=2706040 RepID=UPI0013D8FA11|nr:CBM35 domain-containing protein [Streptomyces sp. SID12488]NEA67130.1 carbohydrate-binding protein [Streptomyces sp. SID12488]